MEVSLWGYKESTIEPELVYITSLEGNVANKGKVHWNFKSQNSFFARSTLFLLILVTETTVLWLAPAGLILS